MRRNASSGSTRHMRYWAILQNGRSTISSAATGTPVKSLHRRLDGTFPAADRVEQRVREGRSEHSTSSAMPARDSAISSKACLVPSVGLAAPVRTLPAPRTDGERKPLVQRRTSIMRQKSPFHWKMHTGAEGRPFRFSSRISTAAVRSGTLK